MSREIQLFYSLNILFAIRCIFSFQPVNCPYQYIMKGACSCNGLVVQPVSLTIDGHDQSSAATPVPVFAQVDTLPGTKVRSSVGDG